MSNSIKTRNMKGETYFQAVAKNKELRDNGIITYTEYLNFNKQALKLGVK